MVDPERRDIGTEENEVIERGCWRGMVRGD
jgi:hypothetical protein